MTYQPPSSLEWQSLNNYVIEEFRANCGRLPRQFAQFATWDLLLLSTIGARSGETRVVPLSYFTIDNKVIVIGSNTGADSDPSWVLNLRANPKAHVEIGTQAYAVHAHEVPPAERGHVFGKVIGLAPRFGEYQAKTRRLIPLFELRAADPILSSAQLDHSAQNTDS
jgi:deazaflavin-dependent oxidoreductase (nitroreductase family)